MTTIKRHFFHLLLAASWLMTLAACSKDDDPIVAYRQDLAEIATDHNGRVASLILDNADTLAVTNKEAITQTLVPDTAYRVRAVFLKEAQGAEVVSLQTVFCMAPLAEKPAEMKADAITAEAIWRSGRYLNLLVSFKTSGAEKHKIMFVEDGITTEANGAKMLHIKLTHDRRNDGRTYTTRSYISCLLSGYNDILTPQRDSVSIAVPTGNGFSIRHFAY